MAKALKINTEGRVQPESHVLRVMKSKGKIPVFIDDILATHDKGQFYKDIYNKGYFEASKILGYIINNDIIENLKKSKNKDHEVFLLGIIDFIEDTRRTPEEALELLNLKEK